MLYLVVTWRDNLYGHNYIVTAETLEGAEDIVRAKYAAANINIASMQITVYNEHDDGTLEGYEQLGNVVEPIVATEILT